MHGSAIFTSNPPGCAYTPLFILPIDTVALSLPCASIVRGRYRYTEDLLALASAVAPQPSPQWPRYHTVIQLDLLQPYLDAHPDKAYAAYIADGLRQGFRIGFDYKAAQLVSRTRNHPTCHAKSDIVTEKVQAEIAAGRLLGPVPPELITSVHLSPMGLIPKPHQANKFRLIVDLSSPRGKSVNDGISSDHCSLQYASIDNAVTIIQTLGRGTMQVKIDLKDAYRLIPVHPDDYHLLGIGWDGYTYVDRALPFGLRSAPKIFSAVADFIAWVLHSQGIVHQLHYLDDFLFLGAPDTAEAARALELVCRSFHILGIPIAIHKTEGPATELTFLGIVIDTLRCELRLPQEKLIRLQSLLDSWTSKKHCRRNELESLLGYMSHAATVVRHGRTFLRQLFSLLSHARSSHHFVHLNSGARADLLWWRVFLQHWNGRSFFPQVIPSVTVTSDASGSFGCGAFSREHGWFQLQWPESWGTVHIAAKELVPIVVAASIWGSSWQGLCICFRTDNMAVVEVLRSRTSRDPLLMHLLRCLTFYAAVFHFDYKTEHIAGIHNTAADALSRNNLAVFFSMFPQIPRVTVPRPVWELLVEVRPDWGSREWTQLFKTSWMKASQDPHSPSTDQAGASTSSSVPSTLTPHSHSLSTRCVSSPQ